ncbi:hypothetical protein Nepgr_022649 [Nepenthes gracilis]|uniref:Uncharacterized protein n=1 Tax=Nepenthes gracilis TaxID=150966 RepID=A0AAD3T2H0_NEPGR|nr:hypothetical protein Nepgr_022649 [Nepenthes gracilis]
MPLNATLLHPLGIKRRKLGSHDPVSRSTCLMTSKVASINQGLFRPHSIPISESLSIPLLSFVLLSSVRVVKSKRSSGEEASYEPLVKLKEVATVLYSNDLKSRRSDGKRRSNGKKASYEPLEELKEAATTSYGSNLFLFSSSL